MTKLFLAAGVAALAISAPASAGPGGHGGHGGGAAKAERGAKVERQSMRAERPARAERRAMRAERPARVQRMAMRAERPARAERHAMRAERPARIERQQLRAERPARMERMANRQVERRAMRQDRSTVRMNEGNRIAERLASRNDLAVRRQNVAANGDFAGQWSKAKGRGFIEGCPPGLYMKNNGCLPPGQAQKLVGSVVPASIASSAMPNYLNALYPDTPNYYYRYNDGYMYQVDRGSNLVNALLPLLAGGILPGQYLPSNYMNSYVPSAYSAFYPNTQNQCTRYANGVVYYVDCGSGLVENFMPLYDNGYGIGQVLPAGYDYYNLPSQYRDIYYNSPDAGYRYAPGAIYQYDPQTSLITSIAALLSPGMSIGQPMPAGYGAYNVPLAYRDTYYDTPDNWYRYSNGNIYQVNPLTQLVTAIVASALT